MIVILLPSKMYWLLKRGLQVNLAEGLDYLSKIDHLCKNQVRSKLSKTWVIKFKNKLSLYGLISNKINLNLYISHRMRGTLQVVKQ